MYSVATCLFAREKSRQIFRGLSNAPQFRLINSKVDKPNRNDLEERKALSLFENKWKSRARDSAAPILYCHQDQKCRTGVESTDDNLWNLIFL